MSKNLTRKGLALGTALSFALAGLSALPASADDAGLVTLMPSVGKTFNALSGDGVATGVIEQGIKLKATVDADLNPSGTTGYERLAYVVSNPGTATLTFKSDHGTAPNDVQVFAVTDGVKATTPEANDRSKASTIYVTTANNDATEILTVSSAKEATFTVQSFLDKDADGIVDATEQASKAETVNLYDPKNVIVSASINPTLVYTGSSVTAVPVKLTFSKGVNADQVDARVYGVAIYKNGAYQQQTLIHGAGGVDNQNVAITTDYTLSADLQRLANSASAGATDSVGRALRSLTLTSANYLAVDANYSARVAYLAGGTDGYKATDATGATLPSDQSKIVWAGPRSSSYLVPKFVASSATVTDLVVSVNDTKNTKITTGTDTDPSAYSVRTGVKEVSYVIQAEEGSHVALEDSNVRVKAVVTATGLSKSSKVSISGTNEELTVKDDAAVVYGRTDSDGKFTLKVTNSGATVGDVYTVALSYLVTGNTWTPAQTVTSTYAKAAVTTFKAVSSILAGSTANASFKVLDQFGQAISANADGALSVELADSDTTKLKKTAVVSAGKAAISFTNYLTKGDSSTLTATLYTGASTDNTVSGISTLSLSLYNPEATGAVIVNAEAENGITYSNFVLGDPKTDGVDTTVAPRADNADRLVYSGRIEDTNGAGLPAAVVVVAGKGLQFEDTTGDDAGEFYKDSITVVADDAGNFAVNVWNHKVGETTITVTSGGKSAKTVLTGLFNTTVNTATDKNLGLNGTTSGTELIKITWNAPKHPGVNGTYVVTAKVTDKWGNALKNAGVKFEADGALTVNGLESKTRTTNSAGNVTVYLGTVKDAKGFGSFSATVVSAEIDRNDDGDLTDSGEVASVALSSEKYKSVSSELVVGVNASAAASTSKGLVKASVWNATGKTVQVYVSGKLVATKKATSASYSFNVKATKGAKKVTVKVAGTTYFSDVITVK